jgi:hypothetical protein
MSLPQFEGSFADPDLGAESDSHRLGNAGGADVSAVGGAQIFHKPLVATVGNAGVAGRDVVVIELDRGVGTTANHSTHQEQLRESVNHDVSVESC